MGVGVCGWAGGGVGAVFLATSEFKTKSVPVIFLPVEMLLNGEQKRHVFNFDTVMEKEQFFIHIPAG